MKSLKDYRENKVENDEEKNGLDTDHDHELGEPKKHKDAVKKAKEKMLDFFEKRKAGAAKIAKEAKAKGGPSMLTAWHFAAKAKPYNDVLSAIKNDKDEKFFLHNCFKLVDKLKFKKLTQKSFQEIMGELEVWGEAVSQLFNKSSKV